MTRAQARRLSGRLVDISRGTEGCEPPMRWNGEPAKVIGQYGAYLIVGWHADVDFGWWVGDGSEPGLFSGAQGCSRAWNVRPDEVDVLPIGAAVKRGGR